ncbi:MAG: hypothetical protein U0470_11670 [Anaerolineae bacterium]
MRSPPGRTVARPARHRAADLDGALAHWPIAPLPADFVALTMARVRAEPRFRLAAGDAVVAAAARRTVLLAIEEHRGRLADRGAGPPAVAVTAS